MTSTSLGSGMRIGSYQIDEVLGTGPRTRVLRGHDASGDVAIKIFLRAGHADHAHALEARDRERRALSRAAHEGLLVLVGGGEDEALGPYLVTRFVSGTSLRALCATGPMLPEHAIACVEPVARTIAHVHARGIVHGDVKPEHVVITPEGVPVLLDLGLAFPRGAHAREGEVNGTLGYVAPEVFEGLPPSSAIDVFALGVVLYELVSGRRPVSQSDDGRIEIDAPSLAETDPRVPSGLADIVARCLSRAPQERPTAEALADALAPLEHGLGRDTRRALVANAAQARIDVAAGVARMLVGRANAAIDDGDAFAATRLLDRALAYAPEDASALAALERAMHPPRISRRVRRRIVVAVAMAALVVFVGLPALRLREARVEPTVTTPAISERPTPIAGFRPLPPALIPNATFVQGQTRQRAALRALDARLRQHPRDRELARRRAMLRLSLGRLRDAHADLLVLVHEDPDDVDSLRALVSLYDRLGESARTAPLLARIVTRRPRDVEALTDLSIAQGHTAEAERTITRAYRLAPRAPRVLARRCSLAAHRYTEEAVAWCEEARRRSPRDPFVLGDLAEALYRAARPREALTALDLAIAARPGDASFAWRRVALAQALGDARLERASREAACLIAPDARCTP